MPPSNPPGSLSSMPKGPFLESPHKTHIFTGEPGARASHLSSPAGTVICCLPFAIVFAVSICLISLRVDCLAYRQVVPYYCLDGVARANLWGRGGGLIGRRSSVAAW